jgi:hypothetical protein
MALTLIATPGAPDANSYATVADGDAYHEAHLYATAWTGATEPNKTIALVMATRVLDARCRWKGTAVSDAQALGWPRYNVADPNTGYILSHLLIPRQVREATCELARTLLAGDRTADNQADAQGLTKLKAGPVELEFKDFIVPKVLSDAVMSLLRDLTETAAGAFSMNVPLVRV